MGQEQQTSNTISIEIIEAEMKRLKHKKSRGRALRSTLYTIVIVAAVAILVSTLLFPFLKIYGASMAPTFLDGDIVCCMKTGNFETGDVVAFYYNSNLLVKRVIAHPKDIVNIDENGDVYVNDALLEEPYLKEKAFGETNINFPYQVPEGVLFVLGDNRATSIDSRHSTVGCIADEHIFGKVMLRVWPLGRLWIVNK